MIKIAIAIPYTGVEDLIKKIFDEHNKYEKKMSKESEEFKLFIVKGARINADEIEKMNIDADVLIARGSTVYGLRKKRYHIPIAEIPIRGTEILLQLNKIKKKYGNIKVGVVGTKNMLCEIEEISEALNLDIKNYNLTSISKRGIMQTIRKAVNEGREYILSSYIGVKCAKELGVNGEQIRSGRDSIWMAISEAKRIAISNREERAKAMQFKTILNYAYEGVITVNKKCEIEILNYSAERILNVDTRKTCIGKNVIEVFGNSEIGSIIKNNKEYDYEIVNCSDIYISLNKRLLILEGEEIGSVITFQNVSKIQEQELKIRSELYKKGLYAKYNFDDIFGKSDAIVDSINTAKRYAQVNSNILIEGETGTGKELFAQSIHNASERNKGPFVAVNCAALPENLLESELFGYVEGAFTGAKKGGKPGLFELAHNGTIFLDEISEISLNLQIRLLRVLQEKEIMRIGSDKITPINVRIISSSNKKLEDMVEIGEFREDLYYRLNILSLKLPPLRERGQDIIILCKIFIDIFCKEFGKETIKLMPEAEKILVNYYWSGNIRELKNVCERMVVLNNTRFIDEFFIKKLKITNKQVRNKESCRKVLEDNKCILNEEVKTREIEVIKQALRNFNGNKTRAAEYLNITRVTLWRKMKELNINLDKY